MMPVVLTLGTTPQVLNCTNATTAAAVFRGVFAPLNTTAVSSLSLAALDKGLAVMTELSRMLAHGMVTETESPQALAQDLLFSATQVQELSCIVKHPTFSLLTRGAGSNDGHTSLSRPSLPPLLLRHNPRGADTPSPGVNRWPPACPPT
jgi:hypothetical protein